MASTSTLVDRVKIVVQSSGTGPFQLGAAVPAYRGVEALLSGATYSYAAESGSTWETGTGVYLSGAGTLVRTPQTSSNGGAPVSFPVNIELNFTALAQDLTAVGGSLPIVDDTGDNPTVAISQRAATAAGNGKVNATDLASNGGGAMVGLLDGASGTLWTNVQTFISYLRSTVGATIIGTLQAGTGAVLRSVRDVLRDRKSVKDYGAKGDGTTNDTAAMLAAEAASSNVYWPEGAYIVTQVPDIAKSWGPAVVMIAGVRVYLRPTAEPATSIDVNLFGTTRDGVANDQTAMQRAVDFAQPLGLPVHSRPGAKHYLATSLVLKLGANSTDPRIFDAVFDGRGCTLLPGNGVFALEIQTRCPIAEKNSGRGIGFLSLTNFGFDGSKGNAASGQIRIGRMGFYHYAYKMGRIDDCFAENYQNSLVGVDIVEASRFDFNRYQGRPGTGGLTIRALSANSFSGDVVLNDSQFCGSRTGPPLLLIASANASEVRGIRCQNTTFYGSNANLQAQNGGSVGDVWFSNHQTDMPPYTNTGSFGFEGQADGANSRIFNIHLKDTYIVGSLGPSVYFRAVNSATFEDVQISGIYTRVCAVSTAMFGDPSLNAQMVFQNVNGLMITNNKLGGLSGDGNSSLINIGGGQDINVTNNIARSNSGTAFGLTIGTAANRYVWDGNVVNAATSDLNDYNTGTPAKIIGSNIRY